MVYVILDKIKNPVLRFFVSTVLCPNPICKQIVGRSNATNIKFVRPEGVNKFVMFDCIY